MSGLLLDGRCADAESLRPALVNYGHFTSMQVRAGAVQGLDLHLARLQGATRELFDAELALASLREAMRHAAASQPGGDCSLRATVFSSGFDFRRPDRACVPQTLIATTPPAPASAAPMRVKSFRYERVVPHIKHVGTFPLFHHARMAARAGFDDALFVDADGGVSEGSVWNLGFWNGEQMVWPAAATLRGTCERLLESGLADLGIPQIRRRIALTDVENFRAAFACNSRGVWPIGGIDGVSFEPDEALSDLLGRALTTQPWRPL